MNSFARRRGQRAQAIAWFVVMLPLFLSVIGLAVDGEAVLRAHRRAQGAADASARVGATHVQVSRSRAEPSAPDVLDPATAQNAAIGYIAQVYPDLQVKASADQQRVVVVVTQQLPPTFLQLAHISTVQVQARSEAGPRGGIDRPIT
jgi:Flp pilus assembly protein TadG